MTKFERALSLGAALVACAAAVWMVPEFRCYAGLDRGGSCESPHAPLSPLSSMPLLPRPEWVTTSHFVPSSDPRISRIREIYKAIEARQSDHHEVSSVRWSGADSADVTLYGGGVEKIRLRVYAGAERSSLLFYYERGELVFAHQVDRPLASTAGRREQRFYFHGGRLIRWLGPGNEAVSDRAPEFDRNSRLLIGLADQLLGYARRT